MSVRRFRPPEQFAQSARLEKVIRESLRRVGYTSEPE